MSVKTESRADAARRRIDTMRCPEHGKRPLLTPRTSASGRTEYSVSGCCGELVSLAQRALR